MPRKHHGLSVTSKQKGKPGSPGIGTYCRLKKGRHADVYDRPYLTGNYNKNLDAMERKRHDDPAKGHRYTR